MVSRSVTWPALRSSELPTHLALPTNRRSPFCHGSQPHTEVLSVAEECRGLPSDLGTVTSLGQEEKGWIGFARGLPSTGKPLIMTAVKAAM